VSRARLLPPWALTALAALLYVALAPPTTDLAAQEHRIAVARDGTWLYDLSWFGGHHLPGYSVLMPLLGLVLGATAIAGLSAVAAGWAFGRLARGLWPGPGGTVAAWWFAGGVGALLFTGRVTFVLGAALALGTLLLARGPAHRSGPEPARASPPTGGARLAGSVLGAVLTALASPVAALFLALVAGAWWLGSRPLRVRSAPPAVALAAFVAAVALAVAFPTGGSEPFVASALWPAVGVLAAVLLVLPREQRTLRIGVGVYLVGVLLAGLVPTPMGGNATRLAALAGGPLLAGALWGRRPLALALLALPFVYWQLYPPVRDAAQAWGDPGTRASYWAPVQDALDARLARAPARVEVVPTARRGEVRWLPPDVPLARGWIRQLDRDRGALFYDDLRDGPLTAAAYRRWLDDRAVAWVVLSDAEEDHGSRDEAALLRAGRVPGLRVAARGEHWTLWRVAGARPLAAWARRDSAGTGPDARGAAAPRVLRAGPGALRLRVPRAGLVDVRVRWSPYLRVRRLAGAAHACLTRAPGGWTQVRTAGSGSFEVGAGLAAPWRQPSRIDCTP
jgi:hypothetical protein